MLLEEFKTKIWFNGNSPTMTLRGKARELFDHKQEVDIRIESVEGFSAPIIRLKPSKPHFVCKCGRLYNTSNGKPDHKCDFFRFDTHKDALMSSMLISDIKRKYEKEIYYKEKKKSVGKKKK